MLMAKSFQMMRFARTKQNLRKKASALSCMGPQDVSATPRKVLEILVPKTDTVRGQGRGRGPTDPDIMTRERTPAEVGLVVIGNAAAPEKLVPAYRSTSTSISTANKLTQSEQNAGLLLLESRARSIRDVSQEPHDSAQLKPDPVANDLLNAALIETSSPISLSKLDSDAFDAALKLQSKNDSHNPSNTNSLNTLLIHSDAIFLPSAMEARTSSAIPSSGAKGAGSTNSEIMRAVEADRYRLQAQHARMLEALRGAAREKIEYRDFIARLMQSHMEHEGRLMSAIAALQGECDRKSCEVERLRKAVAEKERVEEKLEQDV